MSKRDDFHKTMEEQLDLWTARLDALASKIDHTLHAEHAKQLEGWRAAGSAAAAKLTELKATSGDAWDAIKLEMKKVWDAIAAALDEAELAMRTSQDKARAEPSSVPVHSVPVVAGPAEQSKTA